MIDRFFGIDPGKKGAIAILDKNGQPVDSLRISKVTDRDMYDFVVTMAAGHDCFCIIENVSSSPNMGVTSAFSFGEIYGKLQMMLIAAQIPFKAVIPTRWMRGLSIPKTGGDKNILKERAQRLFPKERIVLENADAYLLAQYAWEFTNK